MEQNFKGDYPEYDNGYNMPPMRPQGPNYVQRQVSFGEAIKRGFSNYCCFEGRASRSEYWWFMLFTVIIFAPLSFGNSIVEELTGESLNVFSILYIIAYLVFLLPSVGVTVRRLHDINKSGWWYLLNFVCCVGGVVLIVWGCQKSDPVENQYGPVPNMEEVY